MLSLAEKQWDLGLKGSYFNVMGLPVQRIYEELRKMEELKK
jgi:predicted house-cleaning NTP pyrophosphatase (Maf/HAM1 superfamily)